jgi:Cof subfamily protein (haloacid dehalogenase superfamily)
VPVEACRAAAAYCEAHGYHLQAYVNDELYVPDLVPRTQEYMALAGVKAHAVGSLFLWLQEPSAKLLIIDDPARIPAIQAEMQELLGSAVNAAPSHPQFLEMVTAGVSKGKALAAVAASLGVARDEVMAVGDGMNDVPMLTWAGTSFAMGHAPEALRKVATYVTTEGPGDGVAEALERMGLA